MLNFHYPLETDFLTTCCERFYDSCFNSIKGILYRQAGEGFTDYSFEVYTKLLKRLIIERTKEVVIEAAKWLDEYEIGLARKVVDDLF